MPQPLCEQSHRDNHRPSARHAVLECHALPRGSPHLILSYHPRGRGCRAPRLRLLLWVHAFVFARATHPKSHTRHARLSLQCRSLEQPPPCPISHPAECVLNTTLVEDSQCVFADASTRLAFRLLSGDDHCMIDVPTPPANSTLVFMSTVFQHSCVPYANEGGASAIALVPLDTSVACSPGDIHYAYNATTNELEYENCTSHSILYSLPLDTCINATIGQTSSNYTLSIPCNSFPPYQTKKQRITINDCSTIAILILCSHLFLFTAMLPPSCPLLP